MTAEADTNLDHHSADFRERNYALMRDLQASCPVAKSSAWGGFWIFTSYQVVFDALQDPALFGSAVEKGVPVGGNDPIIPIDMDPPLLQEYRALLLPLLSPGEARKQEQDLRHMANELIDTIVESGQGDLAQDLFTPVPARWILRLLNFDESLWPTWIDWIHSLIHGRATNPEQSQRDVIKLYEAITTEMDQRRRAPDQDVLDKLMSAKIDGRLISACI